MTTNPARASDRYATPEALDKTRDASKTTGEAANRPPATRRAPLTGEQRALAEQYLPMAKAIARPLKRAWPTDRDDFESAAQLALVEAAQSFDPSRNVKFATFARYRILGALRDVQRSLVVAGYRGDLKNAPAISSLTAEAEEFGKVFDSRPDEPVGQELETLDFMETYLRKLPPKHAAACRAIYLDDCSQSEAADRVGCSKSRLSYIHKESMEILNDALTYRAKLEAKMDTARKGAPHS